jgi:GNAT superfamily N-acetyltransferase
MSAFDPLRTFDCWKARRVCHRGRIRQIGCMIIREPTQDDYPQWLTLWDAYNAFYGRQGPASLPPDITETTWHRFFDDDEPVHARVADLDGYVIGLAHFVFHRSTISIAPTCYLQDLFTSENARRRGVATALIDAVGVEARAQGTARLYWQTHETNARARALYDRIAEPSGFIVYRRTLAPL